MVVGKRVCVTVASSFAYTCAHGEDRGPTSTAVPSTVILPLAALSKRTIRHYHPWKQSCRLSNL